MTLTTKQLQTFGWRGINDFMIQDLNTTLQKFGITTAPRVAHFMSQCGHESSLGMYAQEIASGQAYEGRKDLGNTQQGDGQRYKGAGYIQLTGRNNYQRFANFIGDQGVMKGVAYVAENYPWSSAGFWWNNAGMNQLVDDGATVEQITRRVNGGYNGLQDRIMLYDRWINQNQEVDGRMPMKFEADWQWEQLGEALDGLYKKGLINDYGWAEKAYTRQLTQTELAWLNMVIYARQNGVEV